MAESLLRYRRYQDCPDAAKRHNPIPRNMNENGYSPTHRQERCPTCGFWAVWAKKAKEPSLASEDRPDA